MAIKDNGKERLLVYAHYYTPDVASTGQILKDLAEGLREIFDITVICTVPSYSGVIKEEYKKKIYFKEIINGVRVLRIRVPEFSKENRLSRVKNILSYFWGAFFATFIVGPQKYVFAISQPPILGGLLGVIGKWVKHAKYIYNIQDFNPEQIMAVGYFRNYILLKLLMTLDKFSCRQSDLIITVGNDLVDTVHARFKDKNVPNTVKIHNWMDERKVYPLPAEDENVQDFKRKYQLDNKYVVMYSGNIGLYYDLENILKALLPFKKGMTASGQECEGVKTTDGREVVFAFIGEGAALHTLMTYAQKNDFKNIKFIPYQNRENLIYSLNAADLHWCVSRKGIKGVSVPSKVYGIMAVGKPIIGVMEQNTEARFMIEQAKCGKCCNSGDYKKIQENIRWFILNADSPEVKEMGQNGRKYLERYLTKEDAIKKYREAFENLRKN